jgi:hypothetical protein
MVSSDEKTKTIGEEDSDIYEETDYKDVIEEADALQEDYHQRERNVDLSNTMPNLTLGAWLTGLSRGEIIDIKVDDENNDILLSVRTNNEDVHTVRVMNKDSKYTDKNEIVRLLEYNNIEEGRIEKLLGKKIPIKVDRYAVPSNEWSETKWRPYIPMKLNKLGRFRHKIGTALRYLGYEGEFQGKMIAVGFLGVSLFWWSVLFTVISTGVVAMSTISGSYGIILTLATIMSLLMTIYTPLIFRLLRIWKEKYVEIRNKDPVIEN